MRHWPWIVLMTAGFASAALAQDAAAPKPPSDDARYTFHRAGDSFIRLDGRTGQVAQCGWGGTTWACKLLPDERTAMESEIGRLQRDNAELKRSLLSHNVELPSGMTADAPAIAQAPSSAPGAPPVPPAAIPDPTVKPVQPPSDAEIDRAFAFMKSLWRRLVDMMADLQRDLQRKS